jgi:hypothetical protein
MKCRGYWLDPSLTLMNKWLEGFAYDAGFGWIVFLYATIVGGICYRELSFTKGGYIKPC